MGCSTGPALISIINNPQSLVTALDVSNSKCYTGGNVLFNLANNTLNFTNETGGNYVTTSQINGHVGNGYATPTTNILNTDFHSIFFKVRFNSTGSYPQSYTGAWDKIFGFDASSDRSPGIWRFPNSRYIHWRYDPSNSGCDFGVNSAGNEFALNTWYFVGVTKNGASTAMYVNGNQVGTGTVSYPKASGSAPIRLFGGYSGNKENITSLNNLYIFNTVLTSVEVKDLYDTLRPQLGI